jgi:spermidine synthase
MPIALLALLSGVPALIYEVVWTREAALLAGSQVEAISVVLVAFFGGLALGARGLGPLADRAASPLRLYGVLERHPESLR